MKEPNTLTGALSRLSRLSRLSEELIQSRPAVGKRAVMLLVSTCAAVFPLAAIVLVMDYSSSENPRTRGPVMLMVFLVLTFAVTLLWFFRSRLSYNQISLGTVALFFLAALGTVLNRGLEGVGPMLILFWCILVTSVYGKRSLIYCLPVAFILYSIGVIGHWFQLFPPPVLADASVSGTIYISFVIGAVMTFVCVFVHDVSMENRRIAESDDQLRQDLDQINRDLSQQLARIQTLQNQIVQCIDCSKIQSLAGLGTWSSLQEYLESNDSNKISHGICKTCLEQLFDSDHESRA